MILPYEHPHVTAGQGTAALELLEDDDDRDVLLAPVGGGGLIAGSATIATALRTGIRVVGVEPEAGDDTKRSLEAGRRVSKPMPRTIADGQTAGTPGELTFSINLRLIDSIELVSDSEIRDATRFAFDRLKLVIEPSGANALAAPEGSTTAHDESASSSVAATSTPADSSSFSPRPRRGPGSRQRRPPLAAPEVAEPKAAICRATRASALSCRCSRV